MKRQAWAFLIICLLLTAGCQPHVEDGESMDNKQNVNDSSEMVLGEEDSGRTIEVTQGDEFRIELESNITTGYSWSISVIDTDYLQQQGEQEYSTESELVGAGGVEAFRFKAIQPGETYLKLIYQRPFEADKPAERIFELIVVIKQQI